MKAKIKMFLLNKVKEMQEDNIIKQKKDNINKLDNMDDEIGLETQNSTIAAEMNSHEKNNQSFIGYQKINENFMLVEDELNKSNQTFP